MSAWRALGSPSFRVYFAGLVLSQTGAWVHRMAQAWLVLELTGSALALGALAVIEFSPMLVLSTVAGAIADRSSRRGLLIVVQAMLAAQGFALALIVFTGVASVWLIYGLAFVWGIAHAIDAPVKQVFVADLVPRERLQGAVGLSAASTNGARILGPALGGLAISTVGIGWCFVLSGASQVAMLMAIALVRVGARPALTASVGLLHDVRDGLRYARQAPEIAVPLVTLVFMGTFGYNFSVALPLLARYAFDAGAMGFGLMNGAIGFGAIVGGLTVASRAAPADRALVISAGLFAALLFAVSRLSSFGVGLLLFGCLGLCGVFYTASTQAALQLRAEERYHGRVMGLYALIFGGLSPVGGAFTGATANALGVQDALAVNAVLCFAGATGLSWLVTRSPRPES